jgi:hypothetical protein
VHAAALPLFAFTRQVADNVLLPAKCLTVTPEDLEQQGRWLSADEVVARVEKRVQQQRLDNADVQPSFDLAWSNHDTAFVAISAGGYIPPIRPNLLRTMTLPG